MELYYKRTGIVKIYYQESDQLVRIILELLLQHDPEPDKRKVSVLKLKLRTTSIMVICISHLGDLYFFCMACRLLKNLSVSSPPWNNSIRPIFPKDISQEPSSPFQHMQLVPCSQWSPPRAFQSSCWLHRTWAQNNDQQEDQSDYKWTDVKPRHNQQTMDETQPEISGKLSSVCGDQLTLLTEVLFVDIPRLTVLQPVTVICDFKIRWDCSITPFSVNQVNLTWVFCKSPSRPAPLCSPPPWTRTPWQSSPAGEKSWSMLHEIKKSNPCFMREQKIQSAMLHRGTKNQDPYCWKLIFTCSMLGLPGTSWVPTNSTNCLCEIAFILMFGRASIATNTCIVTLGF